MLILFCHCLEFLVSFPSSSFIRLTFVAMLEQAVADDADDQLCLVCPPNIITKDPQNLVKDSSSREDCNALWVIAV